MNYTEITDKNTWNQTIQTFKHPHVLQSFEWGKIKEAYGWSPYRVLFSEGENSKPAAAASILKKGLPAGLGTMLYVPKGPIMDYSNADLSNKVFSALTDITEGLNAVSIKIDPDIPLENSHILKALEDNGFVKSPEIQFKNTIRIPLNKTEDDILAHMKSKTRYNIRLAGRKGVKIREGSEEDFNLFYSMYKDTGMRNGFTVRPFHYYRTIWQLLFSEGMGKLFFAEVEGTPVAAAYVFLFKDQAWYFYGASGTEYRNYMPTYLLQWHILSYAKDAGCLYYDLWGAPQVFDESDPLYGVYRFKKGFGGDFAEQIGAYDFIRSKVRYKTINSLLPKIMGMWKRIKGEPHR